MMSRGLVPGGQVALGDSRCFENCLQVEMTAFFAQFAPYTSA